VHHLVEEPLTVIDEMLKAADGDESAYGANVVHIAYLFPREADTQ
jgi:hypothetical protein